MKKVFSVVLMALLLLISGNQFASAVGPDRNSQSTNCANNHVSNGNFEQGNVSWLSLPDPRYPNTQIILFNDSHDGQYSAMLGGDEGTVDSIRQEITIPEDGFLTYWWRMNTYEHTVFHDAMAVALLNDQGQVIKTLAVHDISGVKDTWIRDSFDLRPYAGSKLWLNFSVYNDNYYFSTFYIDSVCLVEGSHLFFPAIAR